MFSFSDRGRTPAEKREEAKRRILDLQLELMRARYEAGYNSDDLLEDGDLTGNQKAVYQKSPIKPEKFPSKDFNCWELWIKHFRSVAAANGWSDYKAISALPACLTSWALEEFETVPLQYVKKLPGERAPKLEALLEVLEPKMQQYRSKRATRTEFKAVKQAENEKICAIIPGEFVTWETLLSQTNPI